jgi:hypothetical protein
MTRKDRHGWIHQSQLAYAVQELFPSITAPENGDGDAHDLARATNVTIWGLFNIAMYAMKFFISAGRQEPGSTDYPWTQDPCHIK